MTKLNEKATKSWVLALASIASCMVALDAMVVTTALSAIQVGLGASLESLEWTVNAYNLSFAVLLLTATASATASDAGACSATASDSLPADLSRVGWQPASAG